MKEINELLMRPESDYLFCYAQDHFANGEITLNNAVSILNSMEKDESYCCERIHQAYVMCRYMKPKINDLIVILLGGGLYTIPGDPEKIIIERFGKECLRCIRETDKKAEKELETPTIRKLQEKSVPSSEDYQIAFDYYAMEDVCDHMYDALMDSIKQNETPDEQMVFIAYVLAKKAHHGITRLSGEPFLTHPLCVAQILADIRVESAILAAALLHDVGEDSDYTLDDIQNKCNKKVADLVEAVNSIQKEFSRTIKNFSLSRNNYSMDDVGMRRLERMVESNKYMIYALYIKAADRIHSLSTIDIMSAKKRYEKVDETENEYLPLFQYFGLNYFVFIIKDLTLRAADPEKYEMIMNSYRKMADVSGAISGLVKKFNTMIRRKINDYSNSYYHVGDYTASVYGRELRMEELTYYYSDFFGTTILDPKMLDRKVIPVGVLDVVVDDKESEYSLEYFLGAFIKMFITELPNEGYSVANIQRDSWGEMVIYIEDRYRRRFICRFSMRTDYFMHRFGRTDGFHNKTRKAKPVYRSERNITVILLDGKRLSLPEGSIVIDCAFAIHPALGLCLFDATINGEKVSIYTHLHNGDRVRLISATHKENGRLTEYNPNARLFWLRRVKTETAKRELIRYFERKYHEGDNPDFQRKCNDDTIKSVTNALLPNLVDIAED